MFYSIISFYLIISWWWSGVRLSPRDTLAAIRCGIPAPTDTWCECGVAGEMIIGKENINTGRNPSPQPYIPHDLTWDRTRVARVQSWRLTSWAVARPREVFISNVQQTLLHVTRKEKAKPGFICKIWGFLQRYLCTNTCLKFVLTELNVHCFSEMYVEGKINNKILIVMFQVFQKYRPILKSINRKLFLCVHTHTECDTHHAVTKHKKMYSNTLKHHQHDLCHPFHALDKCQYVPRNWNRESPSLFL
jgi:hypothetical protein